MMPVLFSIGPLIISPFGFFVALSFVVGAYLLWRGLHEDYVEDEILSFTIFVSALSFFGARVFYYLSHLYLAGPNIFKILDLRGFPGYSFLGAVIGAIGLIIYYAKKKGWDLWVVFDEAIKVFFVVIIFSGVGYYLSSPSLYALSFVVLALIIGVLRLYLSKYYRRLIWYKSGKPGFVSLTTFALFIILYLLLDFFFKKGIVWEGAGFFVLSVYALGITYYRSGRSLKEDLRFFKFKKA
jgi:prolipoprotein diacylglyceryltransferase